MTLSRLRRAVAFAAMLLILSTLSPASPPALAQGLGVQGLWSDLLTTSAAGRGFEPEVAYDRDGFLHLVFFAGPTQNEWAIYYTNNRSGAFAPPRRISQATGEQRSPDIALGADGRVHVIYEKREIDHIFYVESPDLGATWLTPLDLTRYDTKAYEPAIAVDANGTVHAVFTDRHWAGDQQLTYASRAPGGVWAGPLKAGGNTFDRFPDITTSGSGANTRVHIVYQARGRTTLENDDFEILLINAAGGRLLPPINVSNDPGVWSLEPAIASDGGNELYVAWDKQVRGSHDIVLARSTNLGASWTSARNLAQRSSTATSPALAFGRSGGVPRLHIVWDEDGAGIYLLYEPLTNSFGESLEQISTRRDAKELSIAASNVRAQVAAAYQGGSLAFLAAKVPGVLVRGTLTLNQGRPLALSRELAVLLSNLRGTPTQMRYAFGRAPDDRDPWLALQTQFQVRAPADGLCSQVLTVQLRAADDRRSALLGASVVVDDAVQAAVELQNPFIGPTLAQALARSPAPQLAAIQVAAGSPDYTRDALFALSIADTGECSALARFRVDGGNAYPLNGAFRDVLPLPGPATEGPHRFELQVEDTAGNQRSFTRTLILDRTPPTIVSGTLQVAAPPSGLPTPLTDLRLADARSSDNLYPGGHWGALVANTLDPALRDADPSLLWQPVAVQAAGADLTIKGWNVLSGLPVGPGGRDMAGNLIELRFKLLDGAGNPSQETLTTTVRLAEDFTPIRLFVPVLAN